MMTSVCKPDDEALMLAASLIREGKLVGIPTETVYGLGANALNPDAVGDIFEAKGRPSDNPLIVHIAHSRELDPLIRGTLPRSAQLLAEAYWPGPLTMILPASERVPLRTTGGLHTVAIRMPAHPVIRKLIELSRLPIAAPSGNRSGRPSPTTAAHMLEDMDGRIPLILDGGACDVGVESTVVDMMGDVPRILRPGGITCEQISSVCGACELDPSVMRALREDESPRSPGMKYRHYAPKGQLTIYRGEGRRVASAIARAYDEALAASHKPLILASEASRAYYGSRELITLGTDASQMAHSVFAALRQADDMGVELLLCEAIEAQGIGLAVMNRLGRAAAFHIIDVE